MILLFFVIWKCFNFYIHPPSESNVDLVSKFFGKETGKPQGRAMTNKDSILWPKSKDGKVYILYVDTEIGCK